MARDPNVTAPPSPCEVYNCVNERRCIREMLACHSYVRYSNLKVFDSLGTPTRKNYDLAFPSETVVNKWAEQGKKSRLKRHGY